MMVIPNIMAHGGIECFIMNYYRSMHKVKNFEFVIVELGNGVGCYDDEILEMGGKVEISGDTQSSFLKQLMYFKKIIKKHNPDIVHVHGDADCTRIYIIFKILGIKNIVAHSHNTGSLEKGFKLSLKKKITSRFSVRHLACSDPAGIWLFGRNNYSIVNNAIDIKNFAYSLENRNEIRNKYLIKNTDIVVGCVGHLILEHKNQMFLIKLFEDYFKNDGIHILFIVGGGKDLEFCKSYCKNNNIDNVRFSGEVSHSNKYYSAFDLLALPSHFEGLGICCVEALANGLNVLVSENVPVIKNGLKRQTVISLENRELWKSSIISLSFRYTDGVQLVKKLGYCIDDQALKLFNFYKEIITSE